MSNLTEHERTISAEQQLMSVNPGDFNRRYFMKAAVAGGLLGSSVGCVPEISQDPGVTIPGSLPYAQEADFKGMIETWTPWGADGKRPVMAGLSSSAGLIFDPQTYVPYDAFYPGQFNRDTMARRPGTSFAFQDDGYWGSVNLLTGKTPFELATEEFAAYPYDQVLLPISSAYAAVANPDQAGVEGSQEAGQSIDRAVFDKLILDLAKRSQRLGRTVAMALVTPTFITQGALARPDQDLATILTNTADLIEQRAAQKVEAAYANIALNGYFYSGQEETVPPSLRKFHVNVFRGFTDQVVADLINGGFELAKQYFADDNPNVLQHITAGVGVGSFQPVANSAVDWLENQFPPYS